MAKAIITLTDGDEKGEIDVQIEFDPPVMRGEEVTPSQRSAIRAIRVLSENSFITNLTAEED